MDSFTNAELAALAAQDQARTLQDLVGEFPDAIVPAVERARFIEPEEIATVMAACYTDHGFPSVASADGGWSGGHLDSDAEDFALVSYTCRTRFPTNPAYSVPLNDSQITYIYDYQTQVLTPCLEDAGYAVDTPPSREDFLARYRSDGGSWFPYEHVTGSDLAISITVQCPQMPDHLYG
ncbi:hypothetical protein [Cryobacterium zhongshanensis]|uniref:Uncharacterized protein n=1 Tax=Cryobacterium zhongshanensis TaxID=2928153 RepID=A0AA41UDQ7_9MICO|nr:hypothetical protein [Cryobacterium zhongshanensis]MCI4656270.1 hypothetical protein [Cryobacterium zhongshanensis]